MEPGLNLRDCPERRSKAAFTLVEMLAVVALFGFLVALTAMEFGSMARSSNLRAAARLFQSEISLAKQQAVTFHQEVEVRFFQTPRHSELEWNTIAIYIRNPAGELTLLRKPIRCPEGVVMDATSSTLLGAPRLSGVSKIGQHGDQNYCGFLFRSGGNTQPDLTNDNNQILLRARAVQDSGSLPDNFLVVAINPVNGKVTTYQP